VKAVKPVKAAKKVTVPAAPVEDDLSATDWDDWELEYLDSDYSDGGEAR
jgi:hypothetical protein